MTDKEWKEQALNALNSIIDFYNARMDEYWEDEDMWNYLAVIRTNLLVARQTTMSLP